MSPIIDPSDGDDVTYSDAVETNNHEVDRTEPGIYTVEFSTDLAHAEQATLPIQSYSLSCLTTAALVDHCRHETKSYHCGEHRGDAHCVELLRRATLQDDQDAWQALQQCLSQTVLRWLVA